MLYLFFLMQRYDVFQLIPKNQPDSSLICCDRLIISRQSRGIGAFKCRKSINKGMLFTQSTNSFEDNFKKSSEKLLYFRNIPYICNINYNNVAMNKETIIKLIADYFKTQPVLKAWLFGSFSRGEETDSSDIDILIVLDDSQHIGMKFFGMYEDLKDLLGRNVDLVTDRSLAPFARQSVDHDKILIYERAA